MTPTELDAQLRLAAKAIPGVDQVFDEVLATTGHERGCVEEVFLRGKSVYALIGCCGSFFRLSADLGEELEGGSMTAEMAGRLGLH